MAGFKNIKRQKYTHTNKKKTRVLLKSTPRSPYAQDTHEGTHKSTTCCRLGLGLLTHVVLATLLPTYDI
jgi:hypothetical protein